MLLSVRVQRSTGVASDMDCLTDTMVEKVQWSLINQVCEDVEQEGQMTLYCIR